MDLRNKVIRNLLHLLIALALNIVLVYTEECPPANLIKPCNCAEMPFPLVECGGISDMETLEQIFDRTADRSFHTFALYNSSLQYLPASAISRKKFQQIMLVNVTMNAMFDRMPDPSNRVFMIMTMNSTFLRGVGWELFKTLKGLEVVSITRTEVKSLSKSFVDNISTKIKRFHMFDSRVRKIQYNVFSQLTDLYDLRIDNGGIKSLKRSMFPQNSRITGFYFPNNEITSLPDDLFTNMSKLEYIDFHNNKITQVTEPVFGGVYNTLKELVMDENPIICDCSIRWYVTRYRGTLKGNCGGPEDRKGRSLQSLTPKDFTYCH
ncbi:uncharacterized protein TNCT_133671 [Trichonephila clavata]|uniref:Uncharacterized protein n=1 Tax=Trichonephila clavata TaxID=2740835 RepID=A0A8X6LUA1_TRICU|nr:uncharacterized protein TNCT_133671 [Trichonephila clavata]